MSVKYPNIKVVLVGHDGNAYSIMGRVSNALRKAHVPKKEIDKYLEESTSGDYNNLISTVTKWVNVL